MREQRPWHAAASLCQKKCVWVSRETTSTATGTLGDDSFLHILWPSFEREVVPRLHRACLWAHCRVRTETWRSPLPKLGAAQSGFEVRVLSAAGCHPPCRPAGEGSLPAASVQRICWLGLVQPLLGCTSREHQLWPLRNWLQRSGDPFRILDASCFSCCCRRTWCAVGKELGLHPGERHGRRAGWLGGVESSPSAGETNSLPMRFTGALVVQVRTGALAVTPSWGWTATLTGSRTSPSRANDDDLFPRYFHRTQYVIKWCFGVISECPRSWELIS